MLQADGRPYDRALRPVAVMALVLGLVAVAACSPEPPVAEANTCLAPPGRPTSVGVYEWRAQVWQDPGVFVRTLERLQRLCVTDVYVDLTATGSMVAERRQGQLAEVRRAFLDASDRAATSQIRLHGLAGDPSWGAHPENALNVLRFAKDELGLKRIQFDVEVWALDEWDAAQSETLRSLLELAEALSADASIDVGFAIPFWFDRQSDAVDSVTFGDRSGFPLDHLAPLVSGVRGHLAVMAYRDHVHGANGSASLLEDEFDTDARIFVAQQVGPSEETGISYDGTSWKQFVQDMHALATHCQSHSQFEGLILNDAEALLAKAEDAGL